MNAPILRPQGLASELLENVPGQYEHEEGVESEVSVEITPNSCPLQPEKTGYHRVLQEVPVLSEINGMAVSRSWCCTVR